MYIPTSLILTTLFWTYGAIATSDENVIKDQLGDTHGAVASESRVCSQIGIGLLKRGGNAADAMVGTTLCVGVIAMQHSGIGGGGFMLVRSSNNGTYESIDFRETAPAAAFRDMYENNTMASITGGLSAGVPGEIRGLEYLHSKYGNLPWQAVVHPAVHVARHGFLVTQELMHAIDFSTRYFGNYFAEDPEWAIDFAPNGTLVRLGDTMTRKRYANTLEEIAKKGGKAFYEGAMAEAMVAAVQATNGTMTTADLRDYKVSIREPVTIDYRGYKLISTGAPSSGSVALSALKTIEGYNMSDPSLIDLNTHRLDEAIRYAYAAHSELADPAFVKGIPALEASMLNPHTAAAIRANISDSHTKNVSEYSPKHHHLYYTPPTYGTSHVVTADKSGMSVTLTTTVNLFFGSAVMVPEYGIIMNDEMNDFSIPHVSNEFSFPPSPKNYIRAGKRPLSSITPVIVERPDGSLYFSTGAAGGSRIITATIQALWHVLDHGMTMPQALKQPRFHDQLLPNVMGVEFDFDKGRMKSLRDKGHNVTLMSSTLSSAQGVRWMANGTFEAAGEPRQVNSGGLAI